MSNSPIPDPLQMWRKAITKLEAGGNALANRAMDSSEFSSALHQMANVTLGMQRNLEKVIGACLKKANLPSRAEVVALGEALQRVEGKLDRLLPVEANKSISTRPTRTRVPAQLAPAPVGKRTAAAAKKRAAPKAGRRPSGSR
jgi:hypothetical protein